LSQAESLNNVVDELNLMVKGRSERATTKTAQPKKKVVHQLAHATVGGNGTAKQAPKQNHVDLVRPEDKIPMEDFAEF